MQELQAGQNRPIGGGRVVIGVAGEPREDFAVRTQTGAVLLAAEGRVRDLADLVSAEQPHSREGSVAFAEQSGEFQIDLDAVPVEVARIALVLTVKPGSPLGTTFSVFAAIRVWLTDGAGAPLLVFPLPLAYRGETAMILAELYRHQGNGNSGR